MTYKMRELRENPEEEKSEWKTERKAGVKVGVVAPIEEDILNAGGCKREESGIARSCALTGRSLLSLFSSRLSHFVPHAGKSETSDQAKINGPGLMVKRRSEERE